MSRTPRITLRPATAADARKIHALIVAHQEEGRLLPRILAEVEARAERFLVAVKGRAIVGCVELAPLSPHIAEVRSLVVDRTARHHRVGVRLVEALRLCARREGYDTLCAFTHAPGYFSSMGFLVVPHQRIPEKIATDCRACSQFQQCGQYAMMLPLDAHIERHAHHTIPLVLHT
ncbi:MAG: GNAT family N-acetyltransferase [Acidobacteriaceae bacterium]|jgi:amino-acid N-acetyltransferase|nr:GNAT family N-acetyltransferase [Acidobacteriaceae bacterium]